MGQAFGIIVAGGDGIRMDAGMRKQYLMLDGLPILGRTLLAIARVPEICHIYLVVPEADFTYCETTIITPLNLDQPVTLVAGGKLRQESVYKGLIAVASNSGIAVIHDGVRPFVSPACIRDCILCAEKEQACIVGIPATDTIKKATDAGQVVRTVDRQALWMAQTPQAFELGYIRKAHEHARETGFMATDDASIIENYGGQVKIIRGSPWNIKITTPDDLKLGELMLAGGLFP